MTRLKVLAEDTGLDLAEVTIVVPTDWKSHELQHPGSYRDDEILVRSGVSPLFLQSPTWSRTREPTVWAGAPSYAWGGIKIDFESRTERLITLKRAAAVIVTLLNDRPPQEGEAPLVIRVREMPEPRARATEERTGNPIAELPPQSDGPTRINGLQAGRYAVQAEMGKWYSDPAILGSATVDLVAGETTVVMLHLAERPFLGRKVPFEGTLFIPEGWSEKEIVLRFKLLESPHANEREGLHVDRDGMEPVPDRPGLYHWSVGEVVPGKYRVEVDPLSLVNLFDVEPFRLQIDAGKFIERTIELRREP